MILYVRCHGAGEPVHIVDQDDHEKPHYTRMKCGVQIAAKERDMASRVETFRGARLCPACDVTVE